MAKAKKVIYLDEPPTVEISGGVVHIRDRSGARLIERAMSIKNFRRSLERGQRALDRYAKGEENVVED